MAEQDCQKCKRWKGCPGKEWYHYGEIRWCVFQVIWILANSEILRAGEWVSQHEESGESRKLNPEAHFVKAKIAIAEVDERLTTTGTPGKLLVAQCIKGETIETLDDEAWEVLLYVKGVKRKHMSFSDWQKQHKYRQMTTSG